MADTYLRFQCPECGGEAFEIDADVTTDLSIYVCRNDVDGTPLAHDGAGLPCCWAGPRGACMVGTPPPHSKRDAFMPSPVEIRALCRAVQKEWDAGIRYRQSDGLDLSEESEYGVSVTRVAEPVVSTSMADGE